jgi:hypothetical protein
LQDLIFIKPVIKEICSFRCLELYRESLKSTSNSTCKQYIYQILHLIVKKHPDPALKSRWRSADSDEDDEEKTLAAGPGNNGPKAENTEELIAFFSDIVSNYISEELKVPDEDT